MIHGSLYASSPEIYISESDDLAKSPSEHKSIEESNITEMRYAIITVFSLLKLILVQGAETGDILGPCTASELNQEKCYGSGGFQQCGPEGWVYQSCPVGTSCFDSGTGVSCHK